MAKLQELFDKYEDDFLMFEKVENKTATRKDVHAFMLLDRLIPLDTSKPHDCDIVVSAEHDQIWLSIDLEEHESAFTKEVVLELCRCGVGYDEETESLYMFV